MVSDSNLKARVAAELYTRYAFLPDYETVDSVAMAIAPMGEQGSAKSAIERTALDGSSPVVFKDGTGRSAVALERGSRDDVGARVKAWIERHDSSELPSRLR